MPCSLVSFASTVLPGAHLGRALRSQRRRVRRGLGDLAQPVAIGVAKRLRLSGNDQQRLLMVGPGFVRMLVDHHGAAICAERLLEKTIGDDPVGERAVHRLERE